MKKVKWGIIGCGDVTEKKSGPAFQKVKDSELVAVMRRDAELAKDYALRHQVPKWYAQAEQLIEDPEVNAIYIATPPAFHMEYTLAAAKAGKMVYVEKPMALNYKQCQIMLEACQEAQVPLFVAYYRRALPRFLQVKQLIESGAIGEVRLVSTIHYQSLDVGAKLGELPWRLNPEISGGGLFFDLASHTLDLLEYLLGPMEQVQGIASNQGRQYAAEDTVTGTYLFQSGAHGVGTWCFAADRQQESNEIVGTKGKITFSTFAQEPVTWESTEGQQQFMIEHPEHIQQPLIADIVREVTGQGGPSPSTGVSGAKTSWVLDQLVKGYY